MTPADYDAWYDSPRGRWIGDTEFALLNALLAPKAGETLLDVGCGTGWFSRRFAAAGLTVTGLDNNAERLAYARGHAAGETYLEADALALPFHDASFDTVVSVTALCFVPDWRRAMAEMARVARRRMVLGLLNQTSLLWLDKGRAGGRGAYRGARWDTAAAVRAALAGLPVGRTEMRTAVFLPGGSVTARRLERWLPGRLPWGGFLGVAADISR